MMPAVWVFDVVLGVTLIGIAVRVLTTPDLFEGIVLFIVFGLLMSIAWTRLHAVDVALAEAAIGAGLTGALFLNALAQAQHRHQRVAARPKATSLLVHLPMLLLGLWVAIMAGSSLLRLPGESVGLRSFVDAEIPRSGASNPVTAVLLNFRAYDTLLEIAVLVLSVVGIWSLGPAPAASRGTDSPPGPVLLALVRVLIPIMGVVAGYMLWIGATAPGGAFQGGAVLCASGILLMVTRLVRAPTLRRWPERALVMLGFAAFLAVALGVMAEPRNFLEYPPDWASSLILLVEALLTVSIATILVALFAGGEPNNPLSTSPGGNEE
jgi:multisubunit Na+/H+ antiporter MnhB subunit